MIKLRKKIDKIICCILYKKNMMYICLLVVVVAKIIQAIIPDYFKQLSYLPFIPIVIIYDLLALRFRFNFWGVLFFVLHSLFMPLFIIVFLDNNSFNYLFVYVISHLIWHWFGFYLVYITSQKKNEISIADYATYIILLSPLFIHKVRKQLYKLIIERTNNG